MINTTTLVLLFVFLAANSLVFAYFIKKYKDTELRTTLYWVVAYGFFVGALVVSIFLGFTTDDIEPILSIQIPFVLAGLTCLTMSALSTGIFSENSKPSEIIIGFIGGTGFGLFFLGQQEITSLLFLIMSLVTVIIYFYLAYSGRNPRIAIISLGLLLQGVAGRLSAQDIISTNYQLLFNSIGQIAIAIGLLGIGLKETN